MAGIKVIQPGFNYIDKPDILESYHEARKQAFTLESTNSGFKATGLVPFDLEEGLVRLRMMLKNA
ncbi:hypothetical protein EYZ11_008931 [Aspergillus tanneri]|uniref:Uncharacterized protein n=1 Tax=Aspergillus tanneri TaxID=1220188 RepID=A0A4S3J970_9EURO|nr:hypothetical protein EYZ11_008931 [Aspergillus tanneri]